MHSGQNIAKIFTCVRYLAGLEKLPGAVLWNVGRSSKEEPLCHFIGNTMVRFVDYKQIRNRICIPDKISLKYLLVFDI